MRLLTVGRERPVRRAMATRGKGPCSRIQFRTRSRLNSRIARTSAPRDACGPASALPARASPMSRHIG